MAINEEPVEAGTAAAEADGPRDFIRSIIREDLGNGKHSKVVTRFPPEPNGYLHIGHAKSVCLNFGVAEEFGGVCALRFDDTNPGKESIAYVEAIKEDVGWLGYQWGERLFHASDYFDKLYAFAMELIETGNAYVDSLSAEEIRELRGTLTEPGRESPYRNRSVEENRELFARMRAGEFADGAQVLRAKIDMGSANINMRDPTIYRIRRVSHQMTGDAWCIYPMYDFTQCLSDAIEGVTHSLCTLEFEDHRPLYDWVLDNVSAPCHPRQIEFARLNLNYTVLSKRKLIELVQQGHVSGWDDPRMPTLSGMRRRGFPASAIRDFCGRIGITKKDTVIDMELLENSVREDLDRSAPRAMAVLRPLKVVIENYPEGQVEELEAANHPRDPQRGSRKLPFAREIFIEREDFMEDPPKKFFRLAPGREVRLRFAYIIRCESVVEDPVSGEIVELRCSYDPETRSGGPQSNRKVKGTLHWVSAAHALEAEVRLYDRLFSVAAPDTDKERHFTEFLNPSSMVTLSQCRLEPNLGDASAGSLWQFERQGYFCVDSRDALPERPVFNRAVTLRDTWAKLSKQ